MSKRYQLLQEKPKITRLVQPVAGHTIYMLEDRQEDFAFGGNKVRFYEYMLPDILAAGADTLVTTGSAYSNHIRVTAEVAKLLGLECHILLTEEEEGTHTRNVELTRGLEARVEAVGDFAALLKADEYVEALTAKGRKVYLVPNGGHTLTSINAYRQTVADALKELEDQGHKVDLICLPCASGTTHASILSAAELVELPKVVSFTVANTGRKATRAIAKLLKAHNSLFEFGEINVTDIDKNDYGHPDADLLALRDELYAREGILLDPTYNINAYYGMVRYLEDMPGHLNVLYINTGGCRQIQNYED